MEGVAPLGHVRDRPALEVAVVEPRDLLEELRPQPGLQPTAEPGEPFGHPNAGVDMTFDFGQLIAHAAKTRRLGAGSIVGSGTVSNRDRTSGSTCLAERRMLETVELGQPMTPFLSFGDRVRIEMFDAAGRSIFGAIDQRVVKFA